MARLRHGFGSMLTGKTDGMEFVQMNGETYMRVAPQRLDDELMVISGANGEFSYLTNTGLLRSAVNGTFELPVQPVSATNILFSYHSDN